MSMPGSVKQHWEAVYKSKADSQVSWTEADPALSFNLIREVLKSGRVIDVGGGASMLAAKLVDAGYRVAVLDISEAALGRARSRSGDRAHNIKWISADVTEHPELGKFDVWHDRAVFHFLTDAADRRAYVQLLTETVPEGGHAVIATFAPDGPEKCSGLDVMRYDGAALAHELGAAFELLKTVPHIHHTPWGQPQSFQYCVFQRRADS